MRPRPEPSPCIRCGKPGFAWWREGGEVLCAHCIVEGVDSVLADNPEMHPADAVLTQQTGVVEFLEDEEGRPYCDDCHCYHHFGQLNGCARDTRALADAPRCTFFDDAPKGERWDKVHDKGRDIMRRFHKERIDVIELAIWAGIAVAIAIITGLHVWGGQ